MATITGLGDRSVPNLDTRNLITRNPGSICVYSPETGQLEEVADKKLVLNGDRVIDPCSEETDNKYSKKISRKIAELVTVGILPNCSRLTGGELNLNKIHLDQSTPANAQRFIEVEIPVNGRQTRTLLRPRTLNKIPLPNELKELNFIAGVCLFSAPGAVGLHNDGSESSLVHPHITIDKPISDFKIDSELSFYELEATARACSFINTMWESMDQANQVVFHIPREEYYIYGLNLLDQGLISRDLYLKWIKEVDARGKLLAAQIGSLVTKPEQVLVTQPLASISSILRESNSAPEALERALNHLAGSDPIWRTMLTLQTPQNLKDLNNLSYMYAYVRHAQIRDAGTCLLAVENPCEERILSELDRSKFGMRVATRHPFSIAAVYLHEKIMVKESEGIAIVPGRPDPSIASFAAISRIPAPMVHLVPVKESVVFVSNNYFSAVKATDDITRIINEEYGVK